MLDKLGPVGIFGLLVVAAGIAVIAVADPVIAAGIALVVAGVGFVVYGLIRRLISSMGMGGMM